MKKKECPCGKFFVAYSSLDKFCSWKCSHKYGKKAKKVSDKRKKEEEKYKVYREVYLANNPFCEKCGELATEVHHKNGRNGERLIDDKYFMSVCGGLNGCHRWIHEHPKEAREKGWLI